MSFKQVPAAFSHFKDHFFDYDEIRPGQMPYEDDYEVFMKNGLKVLKPEERRALADFLRECLDGTHAEEELLRLWRTGNPQMIVQPVAGFFQDVRSRLRGLGYE